MAKEEIVLDLSVDQGSMIDELERTKSVIIGLKKEQQDLAKAYKTGKITQEEYAKELVRVEGILKTTQSQYNKTQQAVTGVKTKMDDLIASNNKLASSVKTSTENIRIAGVSVGDLTTKVASLANPVTAAVAVVGALGAAYARSTIGAKDLEFASNQLGAATTILTNNLASLVSSAEDGEGAISKLTNSALSIFFDTFKSDDVKSFADQTKEVALAAEQLQDLQRDEISIRATVGDRLADNQELMTKIQDSQTDINEKTHLTAEIIANITKNEDELKAIKNEQLKAIQTRLDSDKENEDLQKAVLEIEREISNIGKDAERKRQGILRLESNLLDVEKKRLETNQKLSKEKEFQQSEIDREKRIRDFDADIAGPKDLTKVEFVDDEVKNEKANITDVAKTFTAAEKKKRDELKKTNEAYKKYNEDQVQMAGDAFNALSGFFAQGSAARSAFALAAIGVDTAQAISALTAASEANPANSVTFGGAGAAQFAAGLIRILANIVAAKEYLGGSFAGGGDFVTSKPTMIMVGDNPGNVERVTVQPISGRGKSNFNKSAGLANFAGGGSMTYDPVSSSANATIMQQLATANALKNQPQPIVSVKEIIKGIRGVEVKQNVSK